MGSSVEAIEAALGATEGGDVINTACIERLDATVRARLTGLVRRTRCLGSRQGLLEGGMRLVGWVYNFSTPHHSLRVEADGPRKRVERTPAMAAGLTDHIRTMEELLDYQLPLPQWVAPKRRGRPPRQSAERLAA